MDRVEKTRVFHCVCLMYVPAEERLCGWRRRALQEQIKKEKGKHIYCDGGGEIVKLLMEKNLIDEYIISVIPTILGDGKRLFKGGINPLKLKAMPSKHFESGLVQLHYVKI